MSSEKAMAITPHDLEAMATNTLQAKTYYKSSCLSSQIVLNRVGVNYDY